MCQNLCDTSLLVVYLRTYLSTYLPTYIYLPLPMYLYIIATDPGAGIGLVKLTVQVRKIC